MALATSFAPWAKESRAAETTNGRRNSVATCFLRFSMFMDCLRTQGMEMIQPRAAKTTPRIAVVQTSGDQTRLSPLVARYIAKTPVMTATKIGTQMRAAEILSMRLVMVDMITASMPAAAMPPKTGEMTQREAMAPIVGQLTTPKPAAAIPEPTTPPTTAWVVDTGDPERGGQKRCHHHHNEGRGIEFGRGQQVPCDGIDHVATGEQGACGFENGGNEERAHHGHGARTDCRAHIVGHVIGADIQRHIAGNDGTDDDHIGRWALNHREAGPDGCNQQEHQRYARRGQGAAKVVRCRLQASDPLQVLVEGAFAHVIEPS